MLNAGESGVEAKQRLISEAAARGEFGLKLCARHYFTHVEGCGECIIQTAKQFNTVLGELDEELNYLDCLLDELEDYVIQPPPVKE